MNLPAHYAAMREAALRHLARQGAEVDVLLDSAQDHRRGITLLARPPAPITAAIEALLADFQRVEPAQYYYPAADIHLTVLSIISCYSGFALSRVDPAAYRQLVRIVLEQVPPFTIVYSGLTASPGGIMVQGIPQNDSLEELRARLRTVFRHSGLQQSIDQRYSIQTAHSTVIRFRAPLLNPALLLDTIRRYEQHFIGAFEVSALELVFNDWYQRARNTVLLERYSLAAR